MGLDIYAEEMISHYEHPHNKRKMENPSIEFHENNPLCGDDITVYCLIEGDVVKEMAFVGDGCAISIGTASMLTDFAKGKTLDEIEKMGFGTIKDLIGIDPGPARVKCATLALKTLKRCAFLYQHKEIDQATKEL
jgi:SUF system FeS assembly protein, NifU family